MDSLAARLKIVRGRLTQKDFSQKISVSQSSYSLYEQGQRIPDALLLNRICDLFDIDPGWLLTGRGDMRHGGPPQGQALKKMADTSAILNTGNVQPSENKGSGKSKMADTSAFFPDELTARCLRLADENAALLRENGDLRVEAERLRRDIERRDDRVADLERQLVEALKPRGGEAMLAQKGAAAG